MEQAADVLRKTEWIGGAAVAQWIRSRFPSCRVRIPSIPSTPLKESVFHLIIIVLRKGRK